MRSIVESSLKFRLLVVAIAPAILLVGITQLHNAPVDVVPEFDPPYVEIQTEALGLSAAEVEELITVPMEANLLNGVAWLDTMRSESVPGLSRIVLVFERGTDIMRARQMVQERLTQAHSLPNVSKPPAMIQPLSSASRVLMVGLSSRDTSLIEMSVLARWTIRPRLMGVPGVANVAIWGQRERQLQVQVDPQRLRSKGVSLDQVIETTGNALWVSPLSFLEASTPGTGGFIDTANQRLGIRHVLPITTAEDLAQVPLEGCAGPPSVRRHVDANCPPSRAAAPPPLLGDVATVVEDHQPLIGDAVTNAGPGLLLVIEKFPEANTLEVTRGIEEALEALKPGLKGIEIDTSLYRPANFIEGAADNLTLAVLIGSLLLVLVLAVFLFEWRSVLISLLAISVSLVAAALVLYLRGATINAMVVAGFVIALGVVVDDAIMDIENIVRRLRQARAEGCGKSTAASILEASLELRGPLVYATLISLLALVPIFVVDGLSGAFLQPLAISYALAVLASMLVALTVTPALALLLLPSAPLERRQSPLVPRLQRRYEGLLARVVRRPRPAFLAAGVAVLVGLALLPQLGQSLVPSFKERDLLIQWDGAPGTSRPEMSRITAQASNELRSIPGVRSVGAHVGRAVMSDEVANVNSSDIWVNIDRGADYDATVAAVREVVAGYPGLRLDVRTYLDERMGEALSGSDRAMTVRIYGPDLEILRKKAEEVRQLLSGISGVVDPRVEPQVQEPQVEVQVDLAAAQRYGIKPGDVRRAAAALLSGIEVGNLFEDQKVFEVLVVGVPEVRHSLTSIRELLIETPGGRQIRLDDVADVRITPTASVVRREGISGRIDVGANVRGRDPGAIAADIQRALQSVEFPREYHPELIGEYAEQQAAQNRLFGLGIAAAIAVFLLLQAAFGTWRLAAVSFLALPSALVGALLAAFVGGGVISLGSLAGFLAVLAIAARNGIVLVKHYQRLERDEGETFGAGLVLRGARERLVPTLATALATGLALVPFVVAGDIAGYEIAHPMAVVIVGGLVTSTLLNLFVVPAIYLRFGPSPEPEPVEELAISHSPEPQVVAGGS